MKTAKARIQIRTMLNLWGTRWSRMDNSELDGDEDRKVCLLLS